MTRIGLIIICLFGALRVTAGMPEVTRVSLITCGPGREVYELEGHTALRLMFSDGTDLSVNWGVFDFNSPNFLYRFVKGETDYRMAVYPYRYFYEQYKNEGRWVTERELNMASEAKERLALMIDSTLTKGSPVYRYNYVLDNCATRPMDYVESALGTPVVLGSENGIERTTSSFREDMEYYHTNYPWYQFGIDLALGSGIDRKIASREHRFAPVALDRMLDGAYYYDAVGDKVMLASEPVVILEQRDDGAPLGATPFVLTPLFVCSLFFIITAFICWRDFRRSKITLWFHSLYYSIATLASFLLTFLIFISVHESTSPNWLYLWLNPLCLTGAVVIWIKNLNKAVFWWQIANFVALIALIILGFTGVQRFNAAFVPLIASDALLAVTWIAVSECRKRNII